MFFSQKSDLSPLLIIATTASKQHSNNKVDFQTNKKSLLYLAIEK
jgi:hypothetical protein